jgi:hypothetical protein
MTKKIFFLGILCSLAFSAFAQQSVTSVPLQYIQPFDPSLPILQEYCGPGQTANSINMVEWQPESGLTWNDPTRITTPKCYIDCTGQLHCTAGCSAAFPSGCAGASNPVNWLVNGTLIGTEPGGDFEQGSNTTITGTDDPTHHEVHITVATTGSGCPTNTGGIVSDSTFCAGPAYSNSPLSPAVLDFVSAVYPPGGSTTQVLTLGLPVSVGDTILVPIACGSNQSGLGCPYIASHPPTVADSQGNSYTILKNGSSPYTAGYTGVMIGVTTASAAGSLTVTVTNGGTLNYDAIAVYRVLNVGTFEGFAGNQVGIPTPTLVTDTYTTLNNGDFLLGVGNVQANNGATKIYQNSPDWLTLDPGKVLFNSPFYDWYAWSASYQGSAGTRTLSYTGSPPGIGLFSQTAAMIFAWEPVTYPPPGSGKPTFRIQVPTDPPQQLTASNFQIIPEPFAALPACGSSTEGTIRPVIDSTADIQGLTITGGGTYHVEGYCDGTNWTVAASEFTYTIHPPALGMYYPGVLANSAIVGQIIAPYSITFALGMTGSICRAAEGATASAVITLFDIPAGSSTPSSFATCTFAGSGSAYQTGTVTSSAAKTVAAGDIIQAVGPTTADASLGDVSITLLGNP